MRAEEREALINVSACTLGAQILLPKGFNTFSVASRVSQAAD